MGRDLLNFNKGEGDESMAEFVEEPAAPVTKHRARVIQRKRAPAEKKEQVEAAMSKTKKTPTKRTKRKDRASAEIKKLKDKTTFEIPALAFRKAVRGILNRLDTSGQLKGTDIRFQQAALDAMQLACESLAIEKFAEGQLTRMVDGCATHKAFHSWVGLGAISRTLANDVMNFYIDTDFAPKMLTEAFGSPKVQKPIKTRKKANGTKNGATSPAKVK